MPNIQFIVVSAVLSVFVAAVVALVFYLRTVVKSHLAASALAFLTTTAGTLVAAAIEEVRNLKDPLKPGTWTPEEATRVKGGVMATLKTLGAEAIVQIQKMHGLSVGSIEALLDSMVEEQVELLRQEGDMDPTTTSPAGPTPCVGCPQNGPTGCMVPSSECIRQAEPLKPVSPAPETPKP